MLPTLPLAAREAPELDQELQRILPTARARYVGEGRWQLLDHNPSAAVLQGRRMMGQARTYQARAQAEVIAAGYKLLGEYEFQGEPPTGLLCEELRAKVRATRAEMEAAWQQAEREADGTAREERAHAVLVDAHQAEGRSIYSKIIRKNPHVGWSAA